MEEQEMVALKIISGVERKDGRPCYIHHVIEVKNDEVESAVNKAIDESPNKILCIGVCGMGGITATRLIQASLAIEMQAHETLQRIAHEHDIHFLMTDSRGAFDKIHSDIDLSELESMVKPIGLLVDPILSDKDLMDSLTQSVYDRMPLQSFENDFIEPKVPNWNKNKFGNDSKFRGKRRR